MLLRYQQEFLSNTLEAAKAAEEETGLSPRFSLAMAALETRWGKGIIRLVDGRSSYNYFNLVADLDWGGDIVIASTLEDEFGFRQARLREFRAYRSALDSFVDFARWLREKYPKALATSANHQRAFIWLVRLRYLTWGNKNRLAVSKIVHQLQQAVPELYK